MALTLISIVPTVKPAPPTLTSVLHVSPIPLQTFDITMFTPTPAFVWNFTVSLTGKDAGSDGFDFVLDTLPSPTNPGAGIPPFVALFSDQNLTQWLSTPLTIIDPVRGFEVTHSTQELAISVFGGGSGTVTVGVFTMTFHPTLNGTYHIAFLNPTVFENLIAGVASTIHVDV